MSLWFHMRAAGQLLKRRKVQVLRMAAVAMVGTLWCVVGGLWSVATWRDIDRQAAEVRIDLLVRVEATDSAVRVVVRELSELPSVDHVRFVRENEVWREFSGDVGADDDLRAVVSMPRLIRLAPKTTAATTGQLLLMTSSVLSQFGDVVYDVAWPRAYVDVLDARRRDLTVLAIIAGALSLVMFVLAASYAFRAEIHTAGGDLKVGALLGASSAWVAMPHLFVSILAGIAGVVLAGTFVAVGARFAVERLPWVRTVEADEVVLLLAVLALVGLTVSVSQSLLAARSAQRIKGLR
jgi:cell division protein FtsX